LTPNHLSLPEAAGVVDVAAAAEEVEVVDGLTDEVVDGLTDEVVDGAAAEVVVFSVVGAAAPGWHWLYQSLT
jgi:hypothetical protein